jgi:DNA-binding NtrC family response regulator
MRPIKPLTPPIRICDFGGDLRKRGKLRPALRLHFANRKSVARKAVVPVVQDETFVRMAAVDLVEDGGFEAIEAKDADHAIRILETRTDIRIVFTDIDMPGSMDGIKLAAAVRGRWPPIEIILTSGHYNIREDEIPERGVFFRKPYDYRKVIATLQRMAA